MEVVEKRIFLSCANAGREIRSMRMRVKTPRIVFA